MDLPLLLGPLQAQLRSSGCVLGTFMEIFRTFTCHVMQSEASSEEETCADLVRSGPWTLWWLNKLVWLPTLCVWVVSGEHACSYILKLSWCVVIPQ